MKHLKAGIIGLGVGEQHIEGYLRHPECEVIALCDFDENKLKKIRLKYPDIITVTDADDILENPDINVVSIASFDNYHYPQVIKALANDKHVFVEKPLCLFENEAKRIRSLLDEKPYLKLSSNLILRTSPRFRHLKQMIEKGDFGQLFYLDGDYNYGRLFKITDGWRGKSDFYSVVYGGGVHIIDLMLWLTGDFIVEVAAYGNDICSKSSDFRYNDMVVAILKFKSGLVGKLSTNFGCVFPHFHQLSIYGTKATFVNRFEDALVYDSRDLSVKPKRISTEYPGVHKGGLIWSFIESILDKAISEVTPDDVFNTMSVCFAVEKSSTENKAVWVSYL